MIFSKTLNPTEVQQIYAATYQRFKTIGNHTVNQTIASGYNRVNVTIQHENQNQTTGYPTNLSLRIYDGFSWTAYQNMSDNTNTTFVISTSATELNLSFQYWPDSNRMWSPIMVENITLETYTAAAGTKGLISTTPGATPFYTNASTNPLMTSSLNKGQSQTITFWVNATGTTDSTHEFYFYANLTSDLSISNETTHWDITIVSGAVGELSDCTELDTANTAYTIVSNIVTDHTCFNITASNITLNAQSHTVTCSGCGTSNYYGVNSTGGLTNVTVKNFADIDGFRRGVSFDRTNDSKISNNTMGSTFAENTYAVALTDSDSVGVKNNTIEWNATGVAKVAYGVSLIPNSGKTGGNNNITNNTLTIYSASSDAFGVYLDNFGTSNSNTISDNTFDVDAGSYAFGVDFINDVGTSNSNTIQDNTFNINASSNSFGIRLANVDTSMNSNTISDNTFDINASSGDTYGVYLFNQGTSMNSNTVSNNTINATSSSSPGFKSYGLRLSNAEYTNASQNTINATAPSARSAGIYLTGGADFGRFWDNTITTGNYSLYIASAGSDGSTFWNNTFQNAYNTEINDSSGASDTNYIHYNNTHGTINWTGTSFRQDLDTKGNLTFGTSDASTNNIIIGNNTAYLGPAFTSPWDGINSSANITLYELDEWGFSNPVILRNGVECNDGTTPSCHAYTALDAATVIFSVSAWSNYTIGEIALTVHTFQATDPIDLSVASTRKVWCNATATDGDGWQDVDEANATLFISPATHTSTDDNDTHYTNTSCTVGVGSGQNAPIVCSFRLAWYANYGEWTCNITVNSTGDSAWGNKTDITVNQLLSIDINNSLDFSSMSIGETSGDHKLRVNNTGNVVLDIQVNGTNMSCVSGEINVSQLHYNQSKDVAWAQMCALTHTPADTCPEFQTNFDLADGESGGDPLYKDTYWKLRVPQSVGGACSGWLTVQAVAS